MDTNGVILFVKIYTLSGLFFLPSINKREKLSPAFYVPTLAGELYFR